MASVIQRLHKLGYLKDVPSWLPLNVHYECVMGSIAYGVNDDESDMDVYSFAIPQKSVVFPHLAGEIDGFGIPNQRFEQYSKHGIIDTSTKQEYDITCFSIVKFFHLAMNNNPNMVDALFVPQRCVRHLTSIGQMVRDNRRMFLHKGSYSKLRGYAYQQLHKAEIKNPEPGSKRFESVQKHGWDVKFGYHVARLMLQCQQILEEHDLDLERNSECLKAIRRGEVSFQQVKDLFAEKEKTLEVLYRDSKLQHKPDQDAIRELLMKCLEHHYGSITDAVTVVGSEKQLLIDIKRMIDKAGI